VDIEALRRAENLRAVIAQVEAGEVRRIRDLYGPKKGRSTFPMWARIKVTVTRRERVHEQLATEFQGDKDRFFKFFTVTPGGDALRPYRKIAQAIPQMGKDLKVEMALPAYLDAAGAFSVALWEQRWAGRNRWEVWRELGKEQYP
jgi:hypothetical protein